MAYEDLIILIPCHSLEDFPAELGEKDAESLLNSFAVAWHPALLAAAKTLPRWHRADDPPDATQKRLIFLPLSCESWVPAGWAERVAAEGCTVVRGLSDRAEMLSKALAPLAPAENLDPVLAGDFLALGFCHIEIELLTRKMRHFSNLDEVHLQREAMAAAQAALAGDAETARTRLRACFDVLVEARERFYPVDCYLIDMCLVIPRLADQHLLETLAAPRPVSVLASAADLKEMADAHPEIKDAFLEAFDGGTADLVGGDLRELPLPLMPLPSVFWQLGEAQQLVEESLGRRPVVWGRRRFGLFPQLPQVLKRSGFKAALHVVLDDGIYPDAEMTRLRWEGTGGTMIDALSRIPLAADAATSYLRFPDRMSESMDNDHVAGLIFARWPEVKSPFFDDLRRMHAYAPVLGRWVNLSALFENTDAPTRHVSYRPGEYLTPYLFQSAAREEDDGISRYAARFARRERLDAGRWLAGMSALLSGRSPPPQAADDLERAAEQLAEVPDAEAAAAVDARIERFVSESAAELTGIVLARGGSQAGYLIFNPLGFRRIVSVDLKEDAPAPQPVGENCRVQREAGRTVLTVDVPGAGFVWVPAGDGNAAPSSADRPSPPLAETNLLRNEFFEVRLNEATGGIAQIKRYGRSPNRLSQQLNYRFSHERTVTVGTGDEAEQIKSHYAEMRGLTSTVTSTGPALGEIVTTGEIVDQKDSQRLAAFRQTVRVWRGRPVVEIDVELEIDKMPDAEPWHNYFTSRFAWHDETASLTRSAMLGAHEVSEERIESPHYLEIATTEERTTIIPFGLPFHRKTGLRMIDTLLVVAKERRRRFRFAIAIDQSYPLQAALDAMSPAIVVPTQSGPPRAGSAGWFFHLGVRSVQMLELLPPLAVPVAANHPSGSTETPKLPASEPSENPSGSNSNETPKCGCALRLVETEGRSVHVRLRCFRTPRSARQRDFTGATLCELAVEGDAVLIDLAAYEIADIEVRFD